MDMRKTITFEAPLLGSAGNVDEYGDAALAPCVNALMNQVDNPIRSVGGHKFIGSIKH